MKKLLLLAFFLPFAAVAQTDEAEESTMDDMDQPSLSTEVPTTYVKDVVGVNVKTKWGIMGQVNPGFTFGLQSDLDSDIDSTFTNEYDNGTLGMLLGGNIDVLIGSKLMIGGGGMRLNYNRRIALGPQPTGYNENLNGQPTGVEPEEGMGHTSWEFIGARIGVLLIHKARYRWDADLAKYKYANSFMFYPYAGYHFVGNGTLTIDNYSQNANSFGGVAIQPVTQEEFEATQGLIEAGLGFKWAKNRKGGLMFGMEVGGYFGLNGTKWEYQGNELANTSEAALMGGYLRVTVGGGFFSLK